MICGPIEVVDTINDDEKDANTRIEKNHRFQGWK